MPRNDKRRKKKHLEDLNVYDEVFENISAYPINRQYKLGNLCMILFSTRERNTLHYARGNSETKGRRVYLR